MRNLAEFAELSVQVIAVADNETLTGVGVDMFDRQSVVFVAGTLKGEALTLTLSAQQATDAAFSDAAALAVSQTYATTEAADGIAILEIRDPLERYVRPQITVPNAGTARATFCLGILYGARYLPSSGNSNATFASGPAES